MPSSPWSPTGILTIVSLVALCIISFVVILGSDNIIDTHPVRDIVYSFPRRNLYTPRHRRAFHHHDRAPAPQASVPAASNNSPQTQPTQPTQPQLAPTQTDTTSPNKNTQPAKSPPSPSPSPSPSPAPQPQSQPQSPASSSPPPSNPSPVTPAPSASATPASSSAPSPSPTSVPTSDTSSSASQSVFTSNGKVVSNIANYSVTGYVYSYQSSLTHLGSGSTLFPDPTAAKTVVSANPTAGATASKGFFANKGAVGVVFGMVGLVLALAVMIGGRMILRRYRDSREAREVDEFFEKYSAGGHTIEDDYHHGGAGAADVGAMAHARPDAYPDRSVHYGGSSSTATVLPPSVNIGIPYPPSAAGASVQHSVPPSGHPFATAANASYPTGAPPVMYPQDQAHTADPFYRYGGTGDGSVNMGYAQ